MKFQSYYFAFVLIVLSIFPLGWAGSASIFVQDGDYYFLLNLFSMLAAGTILKALGGEFHRHIHIWIIFLMYLGGYFLKYYFLCYLSSNPQEYDAFLNKTYPQEVGLLGDEKLLLSYFEVVTAVLVCLATLALFLPKLSANLNSTPLLSQMEDFKCDQLRRTLGIYFYGLVLLSIFTYTIVWNFGIGTPSGVNHLEPPLPFRLAGLVAAIQNGFIPLSFIIIVWLTDRYAMIKTNQLAIAAYISFGLLGGIITTSKMALISVFISLLLLWVVTGRLTRSRVRAVLFSLPVIAIFSTMLSIHRSLHSLNPELSTIEVIAMSFEQLLTSPSWAMDVGLSQMAAIFGVLLRINGFDNFLNIFEYSPLFSWDRSLDLLFVSQFTVADIYAVDVLGWSSLVGTAFSPSLLGYFYFVFPTVIGVCASFVVYVLFWHWLFSQVSKLNLAMKPVIITFLSIILAFFSSEGTLESMPQRIILFLVITFLGEWIVCRLQILKRSNKQMM